jgi:transcriptional regulator with XRE-family HTH domain
MLMSPGPLMSPGAYLAKRREAAGLSVEDVALRVGTTPYPMNLRDRVAWIKRVETDVDPIGMGTASALLGAYHFDAAVLVRLCGMRSGLGGIAPRICRACGCSDGDACLEGGTQACAWVEDDLCSTCATAGDFARNFGVPA